ncbi:MAG: hypothetical protein KDC92_16790, partial [Bacteroidetes bacterium]|nr:hypothetical protein [Bacteroidota bacterium]
MATKQIQATWILGGDIQYEDLGGDTFRVTVNVYRDCNGINMSNRAIKFSGACSGITQSTQSMSAAKDITPTCPNQCTRCKSRSCSFQYGIEKRQLVTTVYLSAFRNNGCCNVEISWYACCRSHSISTGAKAQSFYIEAGINICTKEPNNSPVFSSNGTQIICLGRDNVYMMGGNDSDTNMAGVKLDSVVYSLNSPLTAKGSRTTYISPYSAQQPIKYLGFPSTKYKIDQFPFGFHLDSFSGQLMFRPMAIQSAVIGIKAEQFRNGVSVGYTTRDLAVIVINCPNNNPPVLSGANCSKPIADNFVIDVCVGQEICFTICTSDKERDDTVKLSWNKGIQNANFKIINKGNRRENAQFCFTPTKDDLKNSPLRFTVTAQDNSCPINGFATRVYQVNVTEPESFNYTFADTQLINGCGMIQLSGHSLDAQKSDRISWFMNDSVFLRSQTNVDTFSFGYNLNGNGPKPIRLEVKRKGCIYNFYDTIGLSGIKPITIPLTDTAFCFDYDLFKKLKAKGGADSFTYRWMDDYRYIKWDTTGDSIAINLSSYYSGRDYRFYVEAIDTNQCSITDSFNVYLKRIYNPYIQISDTLICDSNQIRLLPVSTDTLYKANWDGIGVKNNVFSNVGIPSGQTYTLYYKGVEDDYCFYQEIDIKNYRRPVVSAGNDFVGCPRMNAVQLNGFPRHGIWSGVSISSNGLFTPPKYL